MQKMIFIPRCCGGTVELPPVEGWAIAIFGIPLVLHRNPSQKQHWQVSEPITGYRISLPECLSQEHAIENARERMRRFTRIRPFSAWVQLRLRQIANASV
jgi:hypothetical protein